MEVDRVSFKGRLLEILTAISEAHFVSFDLELSGVASKLPSHSNKQTLQERYKEIKEAAERYQILQIGLTCVQEDAERERYILRPYNFNLNPLLEEKLDIERIFAFQSGAVEFLLSHGFRMDLPYTSGVPYLSRDEAKLAKKLAYDRLDPTSWKDLQLDASEVQSLAFVERVRQDINEWQRTGKPYLGFLNIVSRNQTEASAFPELTAFEKRLVHQLVRAEYPTLQFLSRPQSIKIIPLDEEREKSFRQSRKRKVKESIAKQTGFRWIVEAMVGGDLNRIDLKSFAYDVDTGEPKFADMDDIRARFYRARDVLKKRRPVLVGHNLFTDIVYFYRCFIGELPDTVEEFKVKVHELFPVVVDTKYMATHNCGDISPASSLEQTEESLRRQSSPLIETHLDHPKYLSAQAFHEAGYDSYLTARIMILLSAKLEAAWTYLGETQAFHISPDDNQPYDTVPGYTDDVSLSNGASRAIPGNIPTSVLLTAAANGGANLFAPSVLNDAKPSNRGRKGKKNMPNGADVVDEAASRQVFHPFPGTSHLPCGSRFSHATVFDRLRNLDLDSEVDSVDDTPPKTSSKESSFLHINSTEAAVTANGRALNPVAPWARSFSIKEDLYAMMPPFGTGFWRVYGNKLRVFGTVESVCHLMTEDMGGFANASVAKPPNSAKPVVW